MSSFEYTFLTIIACGIATWLSRILPFILLKKFTLPKAASDFLSFVPLVIMTALWFSSLLVPQMGHLPGFKIDYLLASIPTLIAAVWSRSLLLIVLVGIVSLAVLRLI